MLFLVSLKFHFNLIYLKTFLNQSSHSFTNMRTNFFIADSVLTLSQSYLVGQSTVLPLIRHTCGAIIRVLQPTYMPVSNALVI